MARFSFQKSSKPEQISQQDWLDWKWQFRRGLKTIEDFESWNLQLTSDEKEAFQKGEEIFRTRVTPYYASLAKASAADPIRKMFTPHEKELQLGVQQMPDPLGEKQNRVGPRLIHRYSDRALFLLTDMCSMYCRYCTRKYFTGHDQLLPTDEEYNQAIHYIKKQKGLREVILSGGDPLTLGDSFLMRVLEELRAIEHIEIIRIGTRIPVVAPMRISNDFAAMLRKYKPVYVMTHFNHPRELTLEAAEALECLVDHGVPVFNQMVLLNGVNNHPAIIQALSRRLLYLRVKPYYMFQCDPSMGTDHLRTSITEALDIQKQLWGHLSGLAMPNYAVDIPQGGGKTVLTPQFLVSQEGRTRNFKGWDGVSAEYVDPLPEESSMPEDIEDYLEEWEDLKSAKR